MNRYVAFLESVEQEPVSIIPNFTTGFEIICIRVYLDRMRIDLFRGPTSTSGIDEERLINMNEHVSNRRNQFRVCHPIPRDNLVSLSRFFFFRNYGTLKILPYLGHGT